MNFNIIMIKEKAPLKISVFNIAAARLYTL